MQRKRSYVEAMQEGSVYDLLEASNSLFAGAYNQNVNMNRGSNGAIVKSASVENLPKPSESNLNRMENLPRSYAIFSENTSSIDGVNRNSNTGVRMPILSDGGNTNFDTSSDDKDLHIHIENLPIVQQTTTSDHKTGIRSRSDVNKLIDEVYNSCAEYMSNEDVAPPRSPAFITADLDDGHRVNIEGLVTLEGEETDGDIDQEHSKHSTNSIDSRTNRQFSNNFVRDEELSDDLVSRETQYGSDDNILEYDGEANEVVVEQEQEGSLIIPNTAISDNSSIVPCLYTGRNSSRKLKRTHENGGVRAKRSKRIVFRNGETNVPKKKYFAGVLGKYMKDVVTTLIECRWRWLIFLFSIAHFILWLLFALMFYLASYANGDISSNPPDILCIENGKTFTGIFTFSVETQVSIGYGEKSPTEECPETIFIMLMEVVVGYVVVGGMVGIVYAKIVRPQKNLEGVGFSRRAVVCMRDSRLCLVVRVWDAQQKHVVGTRASAWLVQHGAPQSRSLPLTPNNPLVLWPTTLEHIIDENSVMYDWSAKDLVDQRFEIVVTLTGSSRLTGSMTQSRTSYLPRDIHWGQRFKNVLSYDSKRGAYVVDHKSLNKVTQVDTPLCSARLLKQLTDEGPASPLFRSTPSSPHSTITSPGWSFRRQFRPIVARVAS